MKGYTIQKSIDLLEKGEKGGSTNASNVSFDNTGTGIDSTNVQGAIVEIKDDIPTIEEYGLNFSTTERIVGTWVDGRPVYEKTVTGTITPNVSSYSLDLEDLANLGAEILVDVRGTVKNTAEGGGQSMLINTYVNSNNISGIYITSAGIIKLYLTGQFHEYTAHLYYVKPAAVINTRKVQRNRRK